ARHWTSPAATTLARFAALPQTDDERRALLADREEIRAGLVDAALLTHRYPFGDGHVWFAVWQDVVDEATAHAIDDELRLWAAPFVYDGEVYADPVRAHQLYRDFFGDELERVERDAVKHAMASTFTREQRFAGLINQGEQRVRLVQQHVTATPTDHGTVVVEIHDEWSNLTPTDLEIQLTFSLPPTAAVTGLWLNDVDDKQQAFPFALAPRGAAQQVYREQVQRSVDPALLEQVGPQQYRLRVFPVPARAIDGDQRGVFGFSRDAWRSTAGKHAHVWLTYETIAVDGVVPVPTLLEARNAFFDDVATRTVQGERVANDDARWVTSAPHIATAATTMTTTTTTFKLADGRCVDVAAAPPAAVDFGAWRGKRVDVVVDRSFAMDALRDPLAAALNAMRNSGAQLETVWTSSTLRNEPASRSAGLPADVSTLLAFGRTPLKTMIGQQRTQLRLDGAVADVVVVLAAQGSFESTDDTPLPIEPQQQRADLLVLHLGALPTGYDDATADAVAMSGGIITSSLSELAAHAGGDDGALVVGSGGGARRVQWASCSATTPPASPLVARLAIRLIDASRDRSDATTIDGLHRIALSVPVVTPYSSMIVLVNEEQRERLRHLARQADRYDREVESGLQSTTNTPSLMVTGAPEPHEWALLAVALFAIAIVAKQRREEQTGRR
ncbi:MAG TPA: TIGR02921 family PEP-CTERM protein, partial [Myxococcota bacterium]